MSDKKQQTKKIKVNLKDKSFDEIIQIFYNNPKEVVTLGVLLETLRKFEMRLIKTYGLNEDSKESGK